MIPSLRVFQGETRLVFSSPGKWLHPLFELEAFLEAHPFSPWDLELRDSIVGRAAAFLILRMGFQRIHGRIVSRRALSLFADHGLTVGCGEIVDRIGCSTEDLLAEENDLESAYIILSERRKKALSPSF